MNYFSSKAWGPIFTPKAIRWLIIITCIVSISSIALQDIFDLSGIFPGPQNILKLSWWGIKNGLVFEPLTFLFTQEAEDGLNFSFLLMLLFSMYVLWIIGSNLIEIIGEKSFLKLYIFGGMAAGIISLLSMKLTGYHEMISGLVPALLVITTVWVMVFPETEILLFFLIPFKAKWIVSGIVGALLLTNLVHFEITHLVLYIASIAIGYIYAAIVYGYASPFPITRKLDIWFAESGLKMRRHTPSWLYKDKYKDDLNNGKVIDITNAQPLQDDNKFVDAMLSKISRYGEDSLSWSEKERLRKISEKKSKGK